MYLKTVKLIISGTKVISILILNPDDTLNLTLADPKHQVTSFPYFFSKDIESINDLDKTDYEFFSKIYYVHYSESLDFSQYLNIPKD